jgi:hypothetical protein
VTRTQHHRGIFCRGWYWSGDESLAAYAQNVLVSCSRWRWCLVCTGVPACGTFQFHQPLSGWPCTLYLTRAGVFLLLHVCPLKWDRVLARGKSETTTPSQRRVGPISWTWNLIRGDVSTAIPPPCRRTLSTRYGLIGLHFMERGHVDSSASFCQTVFQ